ncbi:hypothetical protein D9611_012450 [Ephemerocybe angulata]|uniref:Uncharacterized protein n=1 Tax=Ephemerocybe angulata TaxID=980116 RepID=A0A8H5FIE5_9AGAR|nr:hypothetical protein D9611_012450 [Tulosesus angulatus]
MVVDVSKFHRRSPIAPAHKRWFVMQGRKGQLYIQHCCPFGATASESNSGQVSKAVLGIWRAKGIGPNGKWSDDIYNFNYPSSGSGTEDDPYVYPYDETMFSWLSPPPACRSTRSPRRANRLTPPSTTSAWSGTSLRRRSASGRRRGESFSSGRKCFSTAANGVVTEEECMKIHGSLCHLAFVYRLGRSHLSSSPPSSLDSTITPTAPPFMLPLLSSRTCAGGQLS